MWGWLRETVAGMAEQAGVEVLGLDSAATTVADLATSAGDAVSGAVAESGGSDAVGSVATELGTAATDADASASEAVTGVGREASATAGGLLDTLTRGVAP